jgi:cytochrome b
VGSAAAVRIRIWDAPVRFVHWSMALLVAVSWWTRRNALMDYHRYSGYALLGLLCFRIYWGFLGSSTARFANFVKGPRAILEYLRRTAGGAANRRLAVPGHSPLGALSVVALLALLTAQVLLGLFAVDVDGIESGPLSIYVSFEAGRACAQLHGKLFNVLCAFIALHVAAVLFYLVRRRENLIAAMLHGRRELPATIEPLVTFASTARLVSGIVLAALIVWAVMRAFQF